MPSQLVLYEHSVQGEDDDNGGRLKAISFDATHINVGKHKFSRNRIQKLSSRRLNFNEQLIRVISIAVQYSSVGWVVQYIVANTGYGYYLPAVLALFGLAYAAISFRKYELRALLTPIDETGEQVIVIAKSNNKEAYNYYQELEDAF